MEFAVLILILVNVFIIIVLFFYVRTNFVTHKNTKNLEELNANLRLNQERLEIAFQGTNLGSWEWDLKEKILWNKNNELVFGYNAGSPYRPVSDFLQRVHPDDLETVLVIGKEALKNRSLFQNEFRVVWPDGSVHWVYCVGRAVYENNQPIKMIGINLEITSQKKVQEELLNKQSQIALATEVAQLGTWEADLINGTHKWSPKALEIFGFDPLTFSGDHNSFRERVEPEDVARIRKDLALSFKSKKDAHFEFRITLPNGDKRWISSHTRPLFDLTGRPVRFVATMRDVTSEKHSSEILTNQRKWLELVLDQMPTPLVMVEPKTAKILFSNKEANKIAGYSIPDANPLDNTQFYCTDSLGKRIPQSELPAPRAAKGASIQNYEMNWHTPDGVRSVFVNASTIEAQYGQPPIILMPYQDITKLKRTESDLAKAINIRDEFLSVASHELKTPLTSLKLQLEMARRQVDLTKETIEPDKLLKIFDVAIRQSNRLAILIDDLLDVSKIRAGRFVYSYNRVEVLDIVKKAIERTYSQIQRANCSMEVDVPDSIFATWDSSRIDQVLVNLLSNAAKYAPGKPIIVSAFKQRESVVLSVKDFGPGISKENQKVIFNRFERGRSTGQDIAGMGLGLFIVKEIVRGHYGEIRIESEIGQGSTFIVELPSDAEKARLRA